MKARYQTVHRIGQPQQAKGPLFSKQNKPHSKAELLQVSGLLIAHSWNKLVETRQCTLHKNKNKIGVLAQPQICAHMVTATQVFDAMQTRDSPITPFAVC